MVLWILRWLIVGTVWTITKYLLISEDERLRMIEEEYGVSTKVAEIANFVGTMLNVPIWPIDVMYTVYNIVKYIRK